MYDHPPNAAPAMSKNSTTQRTILAVRSLVRGAATIFIEKAGARSMSPE
jgi:hypothetical protein